MGARDDISGVSISFRELIPSLGLLSGSFEAYGNRGSFQPGNNFLQLKGTPWLGHRWTVTAGDFHSVPGLLELPFSNLYFPELSARGVQAEASSGASRYTFFVGRETLLAGPRVPYRLPAPQSVAGVSGLRQVTGRLRAGARLVRFWTTPDSMLQTPWLFPAGQQFLTTTTATVQSLYTAGSLKVYGEASASNASEAVGQRGSNSTSALAAVSWETAPLTIRVNYAYLGAAYLPIAGYQAGDRKGPYAELRYKPTRRLELFASASRYANNLTNRDDVPSLLSSTATLGVSTSLPANVTASGQVSLLRLSTASPELEAANRSNNRQFTGTLSRPFGHHTLRSTLQDMKLSWLGQSNRQRSGEFEDTLSYGRLTLSAAFRVQRMGGPSERTSVFGRGSGQVRLGRLSAHGYFEAGKDLVNQSIFALQTLKTTTAGMTANLGKNWSLTADVFRYSLDQALNPENAFVLQNRGIGVFTSLVGLDNWNYYFRLSKSLSWGKGSEQGGLDRYSMESVRLAGSIEGVVHAGFLDSAAPAANIPVALDQSRVTLTGADGRFRFAEVPEGLHRVAIAIRELPAEYDAGEEPAAVSVRPRRIARADLTVIPLTRVEGRISGPAGVPLENVVVRLLPTKRYTTSDSDGRFSFENLREGDYEVVLDTESLPQHAVLTSANRIPAAARCGSQPPPVAFRLEIHQPEKPIRKVILEDPLG